MCKADEPKADYFSISKREVMEKGTVGKTPFIPLYWAFLWEEKQEVVPPPEGAAKGLL